MILYLHGFRSSPQSFKAMLMAERMQQLGLADEYLCPQLPESPRACVDLALDLLRGIPIGKVSLVGSSLGGFYATALAERTGCRAVLLNPVVDPFRVVPEDVGPDSGILAQEWLSFTQPYTAELRDLLAPRITLAQRYLLLAGTADELLDWRQMTARYAGARQIVIEGGDHGLSGFADHLDDVLAFCGVSVPRHERG
jgi:hypothetical protein